MTGAPAPSPRPCGTCPYRRDVPAGVWAAEEYAKLPPYDRPTGEQPPLAFYCHQQDGRLCAGWVGCHDMRESLSLRFEVLTGALTGDAFDAVLDYTTDVPLFRSGREAADHGLSGVAHPDDGARRSITRLQRKRARTP